MLRSCTFGHDTIRAITPSLLPAQIKEHDIKELLMRSHPKIGAFGASHEQQMMVISSPLSEFRALWSSHCQVKNRPHAADSADPCYNFLLFSVARGAGWLLYGHAMDIAIVP